MRRVLLTAVAARFALASLVVASAQEKASINDRLDHAAQIVQEITSPNTNAGIPHQNARAQ